MVVAVAVAVIVFLLIRISPLPALTPTKPALIEPPALLLMLAFVVASTAVPPVVVLVLMVPLLFTVKLSLALIPYAAPLIVAAALLLMVRAPNASTPMDVMIAVPWMTPPELLVMVPKVPSAPLMPSELPEMLPELVIVEPTPPVNEIPWNEVATELIVPVARLLMVVAADTVTPAELFPAKAVKLPELLVVYKGTVITSGEVVPKLPVSVLPKTTVIVPLPEPAVRVSANAGPAKVE